MKKDKEKWGFRKWTSWVLQCLSYIAGIALAVKQFLPVEVNYAITSKGIHPHTHSVIQPNWFTLAWLVTMMLIVTFGARYWRNK